MPWSNRSGCRSRVGWSARNEKELKRFREKAYDNLSEDGDGQLVYLAPTRVNLNLTMELWPNVKFLAVREL